MPQRQPKAAIEAAERPLLEAYARAWQRVMDLQDQIGADPAKWRQARKLKSAQRAIEYELDRLDAQAYDWFRTEFPRVYAMGVNAGARELGAPASAVWNLINPDAVAKMAGDGFADLLKATKVTRRTTKTLIRQVIGDEVMHKLIAGDTAKAAAKRAQQIIEQHGVYSVRYKDGSVHGLREYSQMAVRTKTAVAYNVGTLDAQESQGVRYWEVFDGICGWTFHDDTAANGMIVTREQALEYPISHPNCRRAFGGRPDLSAPQPAQTPGAPRTLAESKEAVQKATEGRLARRRPKG